MTFYYYSEKITAKVIAEGILLCDLFSKSGLTDQADYRLRRKNMNESKSFEGGFQRTRLSRRRVRMTNQLRTQVIVGSGNLAVISDESKMLVSLSSLMLFRRERHLILLVYGKRSVLLFEEC